MIKGVLNIAIILSFIGQAFGQKQWTVVFLSDKDNAPIISLLAYSPELKKEFRTNKSGIISIGEPGANKISLVTMAEGFKSETYWLTPFIDDTIIVHSQVVHLDEVHVTDSSEKYELQQLQMRSVEDMYIFSAKKSERIELEKISANLSTNNSRQVYSKVPGLNIFESNGAGLNTEIGGRGLSPERSTNFNMRQNGYDISADALGYPDAYYAPPSEGVARIEVVRGAGALQYGTQFGGMINYKMKTPDTDKVIQIESRQTVGSFGFFNSYNAIGGKSKKFE